MVLMFTVPKIGDVGQIIYVTITNILLTAVLYTAMAIPYNSLMTVRTNSQEERGIMGTWRAATGYVAGMIFAICMIPITNALGGNQNAWIKFGFIMGIIVILAALICYATSRETATEAGAAVEAKEEDEEVIPFKEALGKLFHNKYWVIVLVVNLLSCIIYGLASCGVYYCKWIFGNDNLVALAGAFGMIATIIGFALSKPVIAKLGVRKTINLGVLGAALTAAVRCIVPTNLTVYIGAGLIGSFVQIPLMCLYGVLLAMVIDYNEYTYHHKLVGVSSGAIGIGTKIGAGLGSVILTACLTLGAYDATLEVATTSMRYAIYAFSNYLPLIINLALFFMFRYFDLEEKLPAIREELARRRAEKAQNK